MKTTQQLMRLAALKFLMCACADAAEPIPQATPEQLAHWLRQYPEADSNGDGTLAVEEAQAYRRKLEEEKRTGGAGHTRTKYAFATMSDGVKIARRC